VAGAGDGTGAGAGTLLVLGSGEGSVIVADGCGMLSKIYRNTRRIEPFGTNEKSDVGRGNNIGLER